LNIAGQAGYVKPLPECETILHITAAETGDGDGSGLKLELRNIGEIICT